MTHETKSFLGWTALGVFALIGFFASLDWLWDTYKHIVPFDIRDHMGLYFLGLMFVIGLFWTVKEKIDSRRRK